MQMLDAKLIFMLQLLQLLLRRLLIMLLILRGRLNTLFKVFTDEQDLAVLVIKVLRLDFRPC